MAAELLKLPASDMRDVARMVRRIADGIEEGEFGQAHNMAWVMDCGNGRIEVGLLGAAPEPSALGHLLFALGMRKLEDISNGS